MEVFFLAFTTIFLAEMGDKTQFTTLMLASCGAARQVYLGAISALFLITGLIIYLGTNLIFFLPQTEIMLAGGGFFILMGIYTYFKKQERPSAGEINCRRRAFFQSFSLIFLAELGDKTQLAALSLAVVSNSPLAVFLGAVSAQALNHGLAVWLGRSLYSRISPEKINRAASLLFVLVGIIIILLEI